MRSAPVLLTLTMLVSGCVTHVPRLDRPDAGPAVDWRTDLTRASEEARRAGRPLLIVAVAGERDGFC